jgi:hypothetical protein
MSNEKVVMIVCIDGGKGQGQTSGMGNEKEEKRCVHILAAVIIMTLYTDSTLKRCIRDLMVF